MSENTQYTSQNPNKMPQRKTPVAPETIEYICGGVYRIGGARYEETVEADSMS
jgi:hypothetical protein